MLGNNMINHRLIFQSGLQSAVDKFSLLSMQEGPVWARFYSFWLLALRQKPVKRLRSNTGDHSCFSCGTSVKLTRRSPICVTSLAVVDKWFSSAVKVWTTAEQCWTYLFSFDGAKTSVTISLRVQLGGSQRWWRTYVMQYMLTLLCEGEWTRCRLWKMIAIWFF